MDALEEALALFQPKNDPAAAASAMAAALQEVTGDSRVQIAEELRGQVERSEPTPMEWEGDQPPEASPGVVKRVTRVDIRPCPTKNCPGRVHASESVSGWRCGDCRTSFPAMPSG